MSTYMVIARQYFCHDHENIFCQNNVWPHAWFWQEDTLRQMLKVERITTYGVLAEIKFDDRTYVV